MISTRSAQSVAGGVLPGEQATMPVLLRCIAGLLLAAAGGVLLTGVGVILGAGVYALIAPRPAKPAVRCGPPFFWPRSLPVSRC